MEVGGAYAHLFFDLLEFLELRTLIVTDIDSVKINSKQRYVACPVVEGERTSNTCLKSWFSASDIDPPGLHAIPDDQKIIGRRRVAFQQPETVNGPCGRSFEDAFMHANPTLHPLSGATRAAIENEAWNNAKELKKSDFALELALMTDEWTIPRYIHEGLLWLAASDLPAAAIPVSPSVVLS
jgi:putative ATP-dependent endonuclease of the OLD family